MEQPTPGKPLKINPQYDGSRYGIKNHEWRGCSFGEEKGIKLIDTGDLHSFIQVIGYFKHILACAGKLSLLRGENNLHESLSPSIYRGDILLKDKFDLDSSLRNTINKFQSSRRDIKKIDDYILEPILQHYGVSTTWVDLVDNIWIALWFAANRNNEELCRYERISDNKHVYIIIVAVDGGLADKGIIKGPETEVIDLRISAPSYFVRPHAQHGLLFRSLKRTTLLECDYGEHICGVIRLKSEDVFSWLGNGRLANQDFLFPNIDFDEGYKKLIACNKEIINQLNPKIGSIIQYS